MLNGIRLIAAETFLLLRRDRIFIPAVALSLAVTLLAMSASGWSIADFNKILYDIGMFGFQLTGGLVALIWGTKVVADSRQEGFLEVQLAGPIGRSAWLLGKFLGLAACLASLGVLILVMWSLSLYLGDFGRLSRMQLVVFAGMGLGWLVLAALAVLMATLARSGVALLATVALWLAGLSSSLVAAALGPETPLAMRTMVRFVGRYWDLQQFNLTEQALSATPLPWQELAWRGAYGALLITVLLTLACWTWERRDISG